MKKFLQITIGTIAVISSLLFIACGIGALSIGVYELFILGGALRLLSISIISFIVCVIASTIYKNVWTDIPKRRRK